MDTIIWVDENDKVLGEVPRERAHREGLLCRCVVVYLADDSGNILVQERADGGLDHSAAGHVDPGESYRQAAERELKEELGVGNIQLSEVGDVIMDERWEETKEHLNHRYKIFECIAQPNKLKKDEVKRVFWMSPLKVYEDMRKDASKRKYRGGFRKTLECFLRVKGLSS